MSDPLLGAATFNDLGDGLDALGGGVGDLVSGLADVADPLLGVASLIGGGLTSLFGGGTSQSQNQNQSQTQSQNATATSNANNSDNISINYPNESAGMALQGLGGGAFTPQTIQSPQTLSALAPSSLPGFNPPALSVSGSIIPTPQQTYNAPPVYGNLAMQPQTNAAPQPISQGGTAAAGPSFPGVSSGTSLPGPMGGSSPLTGSAWVNVPGTNQPALLAQASPAANYVPGVTNPMQGVSDMPAGSYTSDDEEGPEDNSEPGASSPSLGGTPADRANINEPISAEGMKIPQALAKLAPEALKALQAHMEGIDNAELIAGANPAGHDEKGMAVSFDKAIHHLDAKISYYAKEEESLGKEAKNLRKKLSKTGVLNALPEESGASVEGKLVGGGTPAEAKDTQTSNPADYAARRMSMINAMANARLNSAANALSPIEHFGAVNKFGSTLGTLLPKSFAGTARTQGLKQYAANSKTLHEEEEGLQTSIHQEAQEQRQDLEMEIRANAENLKNSRIMRNNLEGKKQELANNLRNNSFQAARALVSDLLKAQDQATKDAAKSIDQQLRLREIKEHERHDHAIEGQAAENSKALQSYRGQMLKALNDKLPYVIQNLQSAAYAHQKSGDAAGASALLRQAKVLSGGITSKPMGIEMKQSLGELPQQFNYQQYRQVYDRWKSMTPDAARARAAAWGINWDDLDSVMGNNEELSE